MLRPSMRKSSLSIMVRRTTRPPFLRDGQAHAPFPCNCYPSQRRACLAHKTGRFAQLGRLLAFTDDDCRLSKDYMSDLLRHDASRYRPCVARRAVRARRTDRPTTHYQLRPHSHALEPEDELCTDTNASAGLINGCNMTMRRALVERLGPFDENLRPRRKHSVRRKTPITTFAPTLPMRRLSMCLT